MKVRCISASDLLELLNGKIYDVIAVEGVCYRIMDEMARIICTHKKLSKL